MTDMNSLKKLLTSEKFPRSNKYDPTWILANQMGLNSLWLTEWLCQDIKLTPGMRVLDLGCGKGLSSIFLAREYGAEVWAADLWIKPTENHQRFIEAGVEGRVYPIHTDARNMPFSEDFFDAIICTDAYIYFGTDDLYLDYLVRYVKTGGIIAITVPGFMRELDGKLPEHILPFWAQECWTWHTMDWWRWLWERTDLVDVTCVEKLPDGWALWILWKKARKAAGDASPGLDSDIQVLESDQGRYMGFLRMIASRK
jgi:ubiquinone/menaquinone biosynthesis C-methylase UbiE